MPPNGGNALLHNHLRRSNFSFVQEKHSVLFWHYTKTCIISYARIKVVFLKAKSNILKQILVIKIRSLTD